MAGISSRLVLAAPKIMVSLVPVSGISFTASGVLPSNIAGSEDTEKHSSVS